MSPQQAARVEEVRAALRQAAVTPCSCGLCPSPGQIAHALALDDDALLDLIP